MTNRKPNRPGWYWFLPDENCPTPTGFLRLDRPAVLLVSQDKYTRDMPSAKFVVKFPSGTISVDDLSGDWERLKEPYWMQRKVLKRLVGRKTDG